jgi:RNA polymerase sigma-70 factor (ECF subfamily)
MDAGDRPTSVADATHGKALVAASPTEASRCLYGRMGDRVRRRQALRTSRRMSVVAMPRGTKEVVGGPSGAPGARRAASGPATGLGPDLERALVARAIAGDREAFGSLYGQYVSRVYRFAWFHTGDESRARDATQDVFVAAIRAIGGLRDPGRFDVWLLRIAHNRLRNERRTRARMPEVTPLEDHSSPRDAALLHPDDPERAGEQALTGRILHDAASVLTEAQRSVLAMRFVAGLSLGETAAALGRSEDAVKKLQRRGLAAMRAQLAARGSV